MNEYETRRLENIKRNKALIQQLGLPSTSTTTTRSSTATAEPAPKRRKVERVAALPSRVSARIASAPVKVVTYNEDKLDNNLDTNLKNKRSKKPSSTKPRAPDASSGVKSEEEDDEPSSLYDIAALRTTWTSWTPSEPPPTLDPETKTYHFPSHPDFTPNLSPASILRQGAFGGTYFRPYYSRVLKTTIVDDWRELPSEWTTGLDVQKYLTSEVYDESVNKFGVKCGQSIEEWEASGWIRHEWDVRGWFQWYCRFWMGRRGEDDERQVGRWRKCCGETGRWRVCFALFLRCAQCLYPDLVCMIMVS